MTAPTVERRTITVFTARLLRLYRGEPATAVLERTMRMLATADGHLTADGTIKRPQTTRRTT
ncbi:hypothetical protein [Streptomyces lasiicapitis]|uniref:hypothetical protein n=1 Tax=Streptomyces lasiicapitis TaxID=1923961 RepID=UPI0036CF0024